MTDKARRVSLVKVGQSVATQSQYFFNDPNGTHALVPWETWEMIADRLLKISSIERRRTPHLGLVRESGIEKECIVCIAELTLRALEEIGGGDDH